MSNSSYIPRIAITPGEPAGIGPDLVLQIAQKKLPAEIVVVADNNLLQQRAKQLGLSIKLQRFDPSKKPVPHKAKHLLVHHVPLISNAKAGKLDKANAAYVIETLKIAVASCLEKKFAALVTGPVHKGIINAAGIAFSGHTEFFQEFTRTPEVVMMLAAKKMRVALVTTHLPLNQVAVAITSEKLRSVIKILHRELKTRFSIKQPKIFVSGLNPHAGENGYLGDEEIKIIEPTLKQLRAEKINLTGPLPADTIFLSKYLNQADVILAMYHDQGLPVLKFYGFDNAVNITLGLPFIRTSVDHGTALELAGTGKANADSMLMAIKQAANLAKSSKI